MTITTNNIAVIIWIKLVTIVSDARAIQTHGNKIGQRHGGGAGRQTVKTPFFFINNFDIVKLQQQVEMQAAACKGVQHNYYDNCLCLWLRKQ